MFKVTLVDKPFENDTLMSDLLGSEMARESRIVRDNPKHLEKDVEDKDN